jgi:hypothetical protein
MPAVYPQPPKRTRTHEWIDQRSLALDRAIARKLGAQPALLRRAKTTLERWIEERQPCVPTVLLEWREILDHWPPERILGLLTSAEERPTRLRQSSPFCGILSPQERLAIFKEYESSRA